MRKLSPRMSRSISLNLRLHEPLTSFGTSLSCSTKRFLFLMAAQLLSAEFSINLVFALIGNASKKGPLFASSSLLRSRSSRSKSGSSEADSYPPLAFNRAGINSLGKLSGNGAPISGHVLMYPSKRLRPKRA